ncbi:MAG TPA: TRAP transporter TatT component family protein [Vicinamibacterales bacterium]|jgi:tetratricopeptide (TPR) repeat protein
MPRRVAFFVLIVLAAAAVRAQEAADPDRLYADRAKLSSALEAASIWEARLAKNPRDFESAWKLARNCYWLGGHVAEDQRRKQFERGMDAAMKAIELQPNRPEGHFWLAADMGAMAEGFGLRAGIKYRGPIKKELETVLMLDAGFQQGSADRALGRWYLRVPRLFGGSKDKSVEYLKKSLTYAPESSATHFFLAETYLEMDRKDDAKRELQTVLSVPLHPEWTPEDKEFKEKAAALLKKL